MRPNRLILQAYLTRGAQLWLLTRALLSVVFVLAGTNPARLSIPSIVEVVFLSVGVALCETHRRRERALLGNLGLTRLMLIAMFAIPALLGETLVRVAGGVVQ